MRWRYLQCVLVPSLICGIQWVFWDYLKPYPWILFALAAYFSAWRGRVWGGLLGTSLSAFYAWFIFLRVDSSGVSDDGVSSLVRLLVFLVMGALLSLHLERLRRAREYNAQRFEATFDTAAVGIAMLAPDGRWLRANRKLCEIVGYTHDELLRKSFQDITHPDDLDADMSRVRQVLAGEIDTYTLQKRYFRKSQELIWINLTVALCRKSNGSPDCFVSVIEDINDRKVAEQKLAESNKRYQDLVEGANSAIIQWGDDGKISFVNGYAEHLFGWSSQELVGESIAKLVPETPSVDPGLMTEVAGAVTRPERYASYVAENVHRDGRRLFVSWTTRVTRAQDGRIEGVLAVGNNITEQKAAEAQLKRSTQELERFDEAVIGRELQMIDLKRSINELSEKLGRRPPYDLSFADDSAARRNPVPQSTT